MVTDVFDEKLKPLHAYEVTTEDASVIQAMQGVWFAGEAMVVLPSGRMISGDEMNRWTLE